VKIGSISGSRSKHVLVCEKSYCTPGISRSKTPDTRCQIKKKEIILLNYNCVGCPKLAGVATYDVCLVVGTFLRSCSFYF
jgi:hypothetical protein